MGDSPTGELHKGFEGPFKGIGGGGGLMHFHGRIVRFDAGTRRGIAGARTGPIAWTVDLASLPRNRVLVAGRFNYGFECSTNAWQKGDPDENPAAFLRVYSPEFDLLYSTAIRGFVPFEVAPLSETRFIVVGESKGTMFRRVFDAASTNRAFKIAEEVNPGLAQTRNALFEKPQGKNDGYLMIMEWKGDAEEKKAGQ